MEYHDLINPVDELRLEKSLDFFHDAVFHTLVILLLCRLCGKTEVLRIHDTGSARITCHDDNGIFKADLASLGIGDMSVIQHLQQNIKYIRMCFFNFIK